MIHTAKGFSRILQHLNESEFAVISAFRDENDEKENLRLHQKLKKAVRSEGAGFIELKSSWKEDGEVFPELSLFVPKIGEVPAVNLGKKFGQHSILWANGNGEVRWTCTDASKCGGIGKVIEKFTKTNISESDFSGAFSQLKKGNHSDKRFQLVSLNEREKISTLPISTTAEKYVNGYTFQIGEF